MIQFNTNATTYIPAVQPQLAGLQQAPARQFVVPEPSANSAATAPRPVADDYEKSQPPVATDARISPDTARAPRAEASETPQSKQDSGRQDNGTTDDSRGQQKQQQERHQEQQTAAQLRELAVRDREVRAHEAAHASVGGQYAGAPNYRYTRGPDGQAYATAGEVPIDVSTIPGNPRATIAKLQTVSRAALAPADPSSQDRRVAAKAQTGIAEARAELLLQQRREAAETDTFRREGKTDSVDASRVTYSRDSASLMSCPLCTKPHLQTPVAGVRNINLASEMKALGIDERTSNDGEVAFRASA